MNCYLWAHLTPIASTEVSNMTKHKGVERCSVQWGVALCSVNKLPLMNQAIGIFQGCFLY